MPQNASSTISDISDLIRAVGALLWPLIALYVLVKHERQVRDLVARLRKGKLFGQEIELDSSLKELERQVTLVEEQPAPPVPRLVAPDDDGEPASAESGDGTEQFTSAIFEEASRSPNVALLRLATEIERQCNAIWSNLDDGTRPTRPSVRQIIDGLDHVLPAHVPAALRAFWNVRNRIVHGRDADDDEIVSAIASGLTLWRALRDFNRSYSEVIRCAIPLYYDELGEKLIEDASGVELRLHTDGGEVREHLFVTTRNDYRPQMQVTWDWDMSRVFDKTWYRDPQTSQMKVAFLSSATFVGEPIKVRL